MRSESFVGALGRAESENAPVREYEYSVGLQIDGLYGINGVVAKMRSLILDFWMKCVTHRGASHCTIFVRLFQTVVCSSGFDKEGGDDMRVAI